MHLLLSVEYCKNCVQNAIFYLNLYFLGTQLTHSKFLGCDQSLYLTADLWFLTKIVYEKSSSLIFKVRKIKQILIVKCLIGIATLAFG